MLCFKCQNVGPACHDGYGSRCLIKHHATFDDLLKSASAGCKLCRLFSPYVESYRARQSKPDSADEVHEPPEGIGWVRSTDFGWNGASPWKDEGGVKTFRTSDDYVYSDLGSFYLLHGEPSDDKKRLEIERNDMPPEFRTWQHVHNIHNHPVFSWLFELDPEPFGPEQIWLECRYQSGSAQGYPGQRESAAVMRVSAGSVHLDDHATYCYEGRVIGKVKDLALALPHLWKWRSVSLNASKYCRSIPQFDVQHGFLDFEFFHIEKPDASSRWPTMTAGAIAQRGDAPGAIDVIKHWLQECTDKHELCKTSIYGLPDRLIDVGIWSGCRNVRVRKMDPSWTTDFAPYAILSHCWGRSMPESSKLTESNVKDLEMSLDLTGLAKNFQDAIEITRRLGIPYLWVDALCVIQDSVEHWASESSKMARYYAGAKLCLAGLAASDSHAGLIHERDITKRAVALEGEFEGIGVRPVAQDVLSALGADRDIWRPLHRWRPAVTPQPLNTRSWTFQERVLSRRTVHLTDEQMIWQCDTCLVGEDGQVGEDVRIGLPTYPAPRVDAFDFAIQPAGKNTRRWISGGRHDSALEEALADIGWFECVEGYTKRSPTYPTDLLPALSAIASEAQKVTKASYAAGLWTYRNSVPMRCLLWCCTRPNKRARNGSPTWAWSSVLGPVEHPSPELKIYEHPGAVFEKVPVEAAHPQVGGQVVSEVRGRKPRLRHVESYRTEIRYPYKNSRIEIHDIKIDLVTSNPFGQVRDCALRLTGLVHDYHGAARYGYEAERAAIAQIPSLTDFLDTDEHVDWESEDCLLLLVTEFRDNYDGSYPAGIPANDQRQFLILRCVSETGAVGRSEAVTAVSAEAGSGKYQRIGLAKLVNTAQGAVPGGTGALASSPCAYIEENGWRRTTLALV